MATITFTIPDAQIGQLVDDICLALNYQETINGSANPETKAQFAKRMIKQYMLNISRVGAAKRIADSVTIS
jgi:hypothetical protein